MSVEVIDVAGYAAAVRRALAGLGPEQIEDLTDGLEADLAEAMADEATAGRGADPVTRFGTPEEYAAELGAAAGLEPPAAKGRRHLIPEDVRHPIRALRWYGRTVLQALRRRAWWPPVERFLVAIRPAWWVLRGWVVYQIPRQVVGASHEVLPHGIVQWVCLLVLVVASVQWGRGSWRVRRGWRWLPATVSVVAAVVAMPMLVAVAEGSTQYVYQDVPVADPPANGVFVDGMQVSNLFVYDSAGNPLSGVQIYDDRGSPVVATDDRGLGEWSLPGVEVPWSFVGATDVDGRTLWNVYPRQGAPSYLFQQDPVTGGRSLPAGMAPQDPPRPFTRTPAIVVPSASPAPTAQASPDEGSSSSPSATAAPEPGTTQAAPTP